MPPFDIPIPASVELFFSGRSNYTNAAPRGDVSNGQEAALDPSATRSFGALDVQPEESDLIQLQIAPEAWRFVAYVFFWAMCGFAILMNKVLVTPLLLAGPKNGMSCPPFERDGKGFDVATDSHLNRLFGFNNVRAVIPHPFSLYIPYVDCDGSGASQSHPVS